MLRCRGAGYVGPSKLSRPVSTTRVIMLVGLACALFGGFMLTQRLAGGPGPVKPSATLRR